MHQKQTIGGQMLIAHGVFPAIFAPATWGPNGLREIPHLFSSRIRLEALLLRRGKTQGDERYTHTPRAPLNSEEKTITERVALFGRKATY